MHSNSSTVLLNFLKTDQLVQSWKVACMHMQTSVHVMHENIQAHMLTHTPPQHSIMLFLSLRKTSRL